MLRQLWIKAVGEKGSFSMENRVFNVVIIISFFFLLYSLAIIVIMGKLLMTGVIAFLIVALGVLYYYSRVKKKFKYCISIYACCAYSALIINYFYDAGSAGPTFLFFGFLFSLLIAISSRRLYPIWMVLHISVALALCFIEYYYPQTITNAYETSLSRFIDILSAYVALIVFAYFIINYLRNYYYGEKKLADARLDEILQQNIQIKEQNRLLEQANAEKSKLFSIISHDLRTPIDSITGYLGILSESEISSDDRKEIEQELYSQTRYTSDLLQNLLHWSKNQMAGVNVKLAPVNLAHLVEDARITKVNSASKKGIKLSYNIDTGIEVIADKDMLRIVLRNVINNAVKFTRTGGEVEISFASRAGLGEIAIKDNGIGMDANKQKEIFTLHSNSTFGTNDEKGIGLGLMLCKEFMIYQNGDIRFESELGKGTIFYLSLPLN